MPRGERVLPAVVRIAILVFEGFDELDALGPYEVLRNAALGGADVETLLVTDQAAERVIGGHGLAVESQGALEDGTFDLVIVPGGGWNNRAPAGARAEVERGTLPTQLRELHKGGAAIASVCTGGMLAGAAGITKGRPATTHHRALEDLRATGAEIIDARVVDDGDLLSCGGVTAGIDLALWIVEREWGKGLADGIAREMEHERQGPLWARGQVIEPQDRPK
jgi:transcriptional regulator GlxA family with amidase domain